MSKEKLLSAKDIADIFQVDVQTVYRWRARPGSNFPSPDAEVMLDSRAFARWKPKTIIRWGADTGRIVDGKVVVKVGR